MNGMTAAFDELKPRKPGPGHGLQDNEVSVLVFAEQLEALAAAFASELGPDPADAGDRESGEAGQKRHNPSEGVEVVEHRVRLIPTARSSSFPLGEAVARGGQTGATQNTTFDDIPTGGHELLEVTGGAHGPIGNTTDDGQLGVPERTGPASSGTLERRLGTDVRSMAEARSAAPHADHPTAAGRPNVGTSDMQHPPSTRTAPARQSPTPSPASARAVANTAAERQSSKGGDVPVSIVRQEVHALSAERLSPAAQITNAVVAGLQSDEPRGRRAPIGAHPELSSAGRVVRVLQVRLEPPELGTVNVRMRLDANALEVRIDARQPGTADLLRGDQGALARLLQAAGYDVEALTVHLVEADRSATSNASPAPQTQLSTPSTSAFQAQSGSSQPDGRSGGAHQHGTRQNKDAGTGAAEAGNELPMAGVLQSGGIYV